MLLPVRCFTCGHVIADKWEYYSKKIEEAKEMKPDDENDELAFYDKHHGKILNDMGLTKLCCRRHMLGHVDLIETI
jgi:DNA-directed RNA polymerase subunit N (RpoN/RPB10)